MSESAPQGDAASPPLLSPSASARPSTQAERSRRQAGLFFGGAIFTLFSAVVTRRALARRLRAVPAAPTALSSSSAAGAARPTNPTNPSSDATVLSKGAPRSSEASGYASAAEAAPSVSPSTANANATAAPGAGGAGAAVDAAESLSNSGPMIAIEALSLATLNVFSIAMMAAGAALWYLDIGNLEDLRRKVRGGLGADGTGRNEKQLEEEVEEWIAGALARKERREAVKAEVQAEMAQAWKNERGKER